MRKLRLERDSLKFVSHHRYSRTKLRTIQLEVLSWFEPPEFVVFEFTVRLFHTNPRKMTHCYRSGSFFGGVGGIPIIRPNFYLQTCLKIKKIGPGRGSKFYYVDPPVYSSRCTKYTKCHKVPFLTPRIKSMPPRSGRILLYPPGETLLWSLGRHGDTQPSSWQRRQNPATYQTFIK